LSRALLDAFDSPPILVASAAIGDEWTAAAAMDEGHVWASAIGNEWTASGAVTEAIPCVIGADVADGFSTAAQISEAGAATVAAAMTNEWSAWANVQTGAVFTPPEPGNQRVAVITHDR
jgi:hypothetical protein